MIFSEITLKFNDLQKINENRLGTFLIDFLSLGQNYQFSGFKWFWFSIPFCRIRHDLEVCNSLQGCQRALCRLWEKGSLAGNNIDTSFLFWKHDEYLRVNICAYRYIVYTINALQNIDIFVRVTTAELNEPTNDSVKHTTSSRKYRKCLRY